MNHQAHETTAERAPWGARQKHAAGGAVLICLLAGCPGGAGRSTGSGARVQALLRKGNRAQAVREIRLALDQRSTWPERVHLLELLAPLAAAQGDLGELERLTKLALTAARRHDRKRSAARLYHALAMARLRCGRFSAAQDAWLWARLYARAAHARTLHGLAACGLARLTAMSGAFGQAAARLKEAEGLLAHLGKRRRARLALALGRTYWHMGDWPRGRRALRTALAAFAQVRDSTGMGEVLLCLGRLEADSGDRSAARTALTEALERLRGKPRTLAGAAWTTARLFHRWGDAPAARRAWNLARRTLATLGDPHGMALLDLGRSRVLAAEGHQAAAATLAQSASKVLRRTGDPLAAGLAELEAGRAQLHLGHTAQAAGALAAVLELGARIRLPEIDAAAYALLARLAAQALDRPDKAARFLAGAARALDRLRSGHTLLGPRGARLSEQVDYAVARMAIRRWRRSGEPARFDDALAAVDRGQARTLVRRLARAGASLADDAKARARVRRLSGEEEALVTALQNPTASAGLRAVLARALGRLRRARSHIETKALRFGAAYPAPVGVAILRQALAGDEVLLAYLVGEHRSLLLGVSSSQVLAIDLPGGSILRREVKALLEAASHGSATPQKADALRQRLAQRILGPARPLLRSARRVLLCLSGPLVRLPFGLLEPWRGPAKRAYHRVFSPAVWLKLKARTTGAIEPTRPTVLATVRGALRSGRSPLRDLLTARGHSLQPLETSPEPLARILTRALALPRPLARGRRSRRRAHRRARAARRARTARRPPPDPGMLLDPEALRRLGLTVNPTAARLLHDGLGPSAWVHLHTRLVAPATLQGPLQPSLLLAGATGSDGLLPLRDLLGTRVAARLITVADLDEGRTPASAAGLAIFARALLLGGASGVVVPFRGVGRDAARAFLETLAHQLASGAPLDRALDAARRATASSGKSGPLPERAFVLFGPG